ncbi:BrnT family toxin [Paraburkholderia sp. BL21I4N1]|uniref:BrnT family toxin n=1 Tax=Paraburkholderia sp. BL21I4N1 TaxID=1938801 RepID=UPI000CFE0290|nr:BrnT family toxin [Paraburkholderia sp. BL21I4N1]PQV48595.1 hypothetical protein B0G83_108122 [Paraburkholderia sp. BL21I4N1]
MNIDPDFRFRFEEQGYIWNVVKAKENIANHGVEFEEAAEVFFDRFLRGRDASDNGEKREAAIGYSTRRRLLTVVYVEEDDTIRLISAWPVSAEDRRFYEEEGY